MTAVEWFYEQVKLTDKEAYNSLYEQYQQALELEKKQHGETWNAAIQAHENRGFVISRSLCDFDDYFENL